MTRQDKSAHVTIRNIRILSSILWRLHLDYGHTFHIPCNKKFVPFIFIHEDNSSIIAIVLQLGIFTLRLKDFFGLEIGCGKGNK